MDIASGSKKYNFFIFCCTNLIHNNDINNTGVEGNEMVEHHKKYVTI
jgi:hypothetical protein